VAKDGVGDCGG